MEETGRLPEVLKKEERVRGQNKEVGVMSPRNRSVCTRKGGGGLLRIHNGAREEGVEVGNGWGQVT